MIMLVMIVFLQRLAYSYGLDFTWSLIYLLISYLTLDTLPFEMLMMEMHAKSPMETITLIPPPLAKPYPSLNHIGWTLALTHMAEPYPLAKPYTLTLITWFNPNLTLIT